MPTTANMGLVLPTEGASDDIWDTLLNAVFELIDDHDHTTGKGVTVPSAALKINADVPWAFGGTPYAITGAKAVDFAEVAAADVASYAGALFVNSADSELYFRSVGGTNIQITDGTTLNVSIVGGIGGDYAAVSALFDYDDATDTYRARQEESAGVRQFAKLSIADLIIREYDAAGDATVPVETVTIKSPDALAASYALTLLAALPGSTAIAQISATGQITASNTLGAIAPTTVTASSTIQGTKLYYTDEETIQLDASNAMSGGTHTFIPQSGRWNLGNSSTDEVCHPLRVRNGDTITGWSVAVSKQSDATNTLTARLERVDVLTGAQATVGAAQTNSANNPGSVVFSQSGLTELVTASYTYRIIVIQSDATPSAVDYVYGAFFGRKYIP